MSSIINKNLLKHKVKWYRPGLNIRTTNNPELYCEVDHVYICPNMGLFSERGYVIQSGVGNFMLFYVPGFSTKIMINDKEHIPSVGDVIHWDQNPNIMKVVTVRPLYNENTGKLDHYEVHLD